MPVDNPSSYKPPSSLLFVHKPACVAALLLLSLRPLRRSRTPHARLTPTGPPRLYKLHYTTLHCTVLLACAKPVGPATSDHFLFWTLARLQANHRRQPFAITCPLTSAPPPHYTSIAPPTPRFSPDTRFLTHCAITTHSAHRLDTLVLCVSSFYPLAFAYSLRLDFFPAPATVREQLPYTRHHTLPPHTTHHGHAAQPEPPRRACHEGERDHQQGCPRNAAC